jgi:hypothetical protein
VAVAVTSAYLGLYWDISWHRSIGRDTFWSPPHVMIYACGILAGVAAAYLLFSTTFRRTSPLRGASIRVWGLRGPLGAFLCAWGGVAMIVSAPFDNWWHNAYGLDVKILSPPHVVLAAGFHAIELGAVVLTIAFMNRATDERARRALQRLLLYIGMTLVSQGFILQLEYIHRSFMHSAQFYGIVTAGTIGGLVAVGVTSRHRWACTIMAAGYTVIGIVLLWILPLVPAEPKLGPVYQQVTHFIPWEWPLLIVVPAVAVDLVLQRTRGWRRLLRAAAVSVVFLVVFFAAQWPFADFLMSPAARNWVFGAHYMDFGTPSTSEYARYLYIIEPTPERFWGVFGIAAVVSCMVAWMGLFVARWMETLKR